MRPIRIFLNEYTKTVYKYIYIYAPTPEYIDVTNVLAIRNSSLQNSLEASKWVTHKRLWQSDSYFRCSEKNKKINEAQTTSPNHSIELDPINRNPLKSFNLWPSYKVNHGKLGNFWHPHIFFKNGENFRFPYPK